jgi:hypothetical protein
MKVITATNRIKDIQDWIKAYLLFAVAMMFFCFPSVVSAQSNPDQLQLQIEDLKKQIEGLKAAKGAESIGSVVGTTPEQGAKSLCPPGHYVFGLEAWRAPGSTRYCIGCLTGVRVICKPLGGN